MSSRRIRDRGPARYAPFRLAAYLITGLGAMACVMSDTVLAALSIMVTAGLLGGISSRNAGVPYLAIAQICVGALLGGEGY